MFRFAFLILAGIGLGALLFGGSESAAAGVGFLALIPILFLLKVIFIASLFGFFARRSSYRWTGSAGRRPPWMWADTGRRPTKEEAPAETDRFEEWHRMAHARDEVDSWAPEPE